MTYDEFREKIKRWTGREIVEGSWCGIKSHTPEVWYRDVVNGPAVTIDIPMEYHKEWEEYVRGIRNEHI